MTETGGLQQNLQRPKTTTKSKEILEAFLANKIK